MDEPPTTGWKLEDLSQHAGVSPRTIRYYVQRGLLPAPVFRGRDTVYGPAHVLRLQVIRRLQAQFLPLEVIQKRLEQASPEDLRAILAASEAASTRAAATGPPPPLPQASVPSGLVPPAASATHWVRWVLAPGVELHLAETVDATTRRHAEELLVELRRRLTEGHT